MRQRCSQELHTVLHNLAEPVIHSRPQNYTTSGANTSKHILKFTELTWKITKSHNIKQQQHTYTLTILNNRTKSISET